MNNLYRKIKRYLNPYHPNPLNCETFSVSRANEMGGGNLTDYQKIIVFFNIYAANHWKEIVSQIHSRMISSGLFGVVFKINISLTSKSLKDDEKWVKELFGEKCDIVARNTNGKVYEFPALEYLYKMSNEEKEFYALYLHTKGSGNSRDSLKGYWPYVTSYRKLRFVSDSVREMMMYWNIDNWRLAVGRLKEGYDCYGASYSEQPPYRFFGGNFWWANSIYVKGLKPFEENDKLYRYNAETWILSDTQAKYYSTFSIHAKINKIGIFKGVYRGKGLYGILARTAFVFYNIYCKAKSILLIKLYEKQ